MKKLFAYFDKRNTGKIAASDLRIVFQDEAIDENELNEILGEVDKNNTFAVLIFLIF